MLHEISALPDIFEYASFSNDREDAMDSFFFHLCENGILANLGNGLWLDCVNQMKMPPTLRAMTVAYLKKLYDGHRIINCPLKEFPEERKDDWGWLAEQAHLAQQFSAVITCAGKNEQNNSLPIIIYPPNRSILWNSKIRGRMTKNVIKSESGYRAILDPILRYAKTARFVDPYLNPGQLRYSKTILLIADLIGNFRDGKTGGHIEFQTSLKARLPESNLEIRKLWKNTLDPIIKKYNHRFTVKILKENKKLLDLHNRFLFTDQCGVKTGSGIDCYKEECAGIDEWTLFDNYAYKENEARFTTSPEFQIVDEFVLP
jgi:hypothetical protein